MLVLTSVLLAAILVRGTNRRRFVFAIICEYLTVLCLRTEYLNIGVLSILVYAQHLSILSKTMYSFLDLCTIAMLV